MIKTLKHLRKNYKIVIIFLLMLIVVLMLYLWKVRWSKQEDKDLLNKSAKLIQLKLNKIDSIERKYESGNIIDDPNAIPTAYNLDTSFGLDTTESGTWEHLKGIKIDQESLETSFSNNIPNTFFSEELDDGTCKKITADESNEYVESEDINFWTSASESKELESYTSFPLLKSFNEILDDVILSETTEEMLMHTTNKKNDPKLRSHNFEKNIPKKTLNSVSKTPHQHSLESKPSQHVPVWQPYQTNSLSRSTNPLKPTLYGITETQQSTWNNFNKWLKDIDRNYNKQFQKTLDIFKLFAV